MPQPPLSPQERRLATFCRFSAGFYLLSAIGLVVLLGQGSAFAGASMTSLAASCLVAAGRPRERRHALLAVAAGLATLALVALVQGGPLRSWLLGVGVPLLLLTLFIYRSAAPGVHSEPAREGPPASEPEPADRKIQLGIKSN